jgi:hypothetical protein
VDTGASELERKPRPEPRWPRILALITLIAVPILLPDRFQLLPAWILPAFATIFLVAVAVTDAERTTRRSKQLRASAIGFISVMILAGSLYTIRLTRELIVGGAVTQSAEALLSTSALIWTYNNIIFGFLYWELDSGGPAARAMHPPRLPDLAFPQHMQPDIAPTTWRPMFIDYQYLGWTNATAFSPTDTMPLVAWAKVTMALQSLISLLLLSLVLARAISVLA